VCPIGLSGSESGGVIDPADVRGAGAMEWESVVGIPPSHPRVAAGERGYVVADAWSHVVTQPYSQSGPSSDVITTPDGSPAPVITHWKDLLNPHGSVAPWLLVILVAIVFLSHLRLKAGGAAGGFGKNLKAGASFG
jgi:hypothetical protein